MKKFVLLMTSLCSVGIFGVTSTQASELNFSVDTVLPDNQREGSTYFDLDMTAGQKQTLVTKIKNHSDKEIEVEALIEPATTNINGVVDYGQTKDTVDDTAPANLKEIAKADSQTVKIPANGSYDYKVTIEMPEKAFDGLIAGGLTFKEVEEEEKEDETAGGMTIENKFAYSVAVLLRENDNSLPSDLKLNKVEADQLNARNVIYSYLQNPVAKYMNQLKVDAKVTKQGKSETLYETTKEGIQMAPNTTMAFPLRMEGKKLAAGKYTMHIEASSGSDKWSLEKDFEITSEEAKKYNEKDVSIEEDNTNLYLMIGIGVIAALLAIIILLLVKKKK
ncbi:DUF916 and DUF3324 domain-containing protein [Vagococcus xieshaowenii]|uniref:DUF916 and DUF3324 domain-containing protein n=1 Tax=Vagococcus xieshaowenii TaxID=2562451 RepID=A0AAJ5EES3_9ENTE|nr:DUF916 and DUF3324 domain-containing protein [Vagococcus xieshaowenii]QCA29459.1 DUF916 and DUF3324 domain-containing protein [Vagococcus xieshaowenii]TFZ39614.1 DUF916 and DUF3324 domain-containing protein [Vagococcus xieshaowenii]